VRTKFSGDASHIACGDAAVVAPGSANIISQMVHGACNTPASALLQSYLGLKRPVLVLPNMHDSLAQSPAIAKNIESLEQIGATLMSPRLEEGKRKFPDPTVLADEVAHSLNKHHGHQSVLITMGSTRGYIDDVRYVSNYSSGKLGSLVSEELYRQGFATHVVSGPCDNKPHAYGVLTNTLTNEEMEEQALSAVNAGAQAAVMAASVLDYTPRSKQAGKIKSDQTNLSVEFDQTSKIISNINPTTGIKVGFKLETGLTDQRAKEIAESYIPKYGLSLFVLNDLADVSASDHKAIIYDRRMQEVKRVEGKSSLARTIADHVSHELGGQG
jgi:phosphopantothenoylcysteine decarboxylase/phosphopantothenate--cysteine ligase